MEAFVPYSNNITIRASGFSLWGLGYSLGLGMEDLTQSWKKLSLTEVEETNIDLSNDKKNKVSVLAAKFFTRRMRN